MKTEREKRVNMANKRLKKTILQVVNNQLKDPATAYVKEEYDKMRNIKNTTTFWQKKLGGFLKSNQPPKYNAT